MSLASWFYKAFTPKQELLVAARNLVSMIENNLEAARLMAKLDGIELERHNADLVRTTYRRILTELIEDWNLHQGNDEYKLKLTKIDHGTHSGTITDRTHTYQYTLRGKGINLAYRIIIDESEEYWANRAEEFAHQSLLLSLSKAGINALNPEVYSPSMSVLPQKYSFVRTELHL